jgi:tetratricopeptide (TPR) repeat protein
MVQLPPTRSVRRRAKRIDEDMEDTESLDAKKVDAAVELIPQGRLQQADALLEEVCRRTPTDWQERCELDVGRQENAKEQRKVTWRANAYPRAWHYRGFLAVKQQRPADAMAFLDRALQLQPRHPVPRLEKARACAMMGDHAAAITLYDEVLALWDEIHGRIRAVALRGRGVQLIDLKRLDEAERVLRDSLKLEPNSEVALNELEYIRELRAGGQAQGTESVATTVSGPLACSLCGSENLDGGRMATVDGIVVYGCRICLEKPPPVKKKWWKLW